MDAANLRPLSIGETLDVAIKLYRNRFPTLAKAVLVVIAPLFVLGGLIQLSLLPTLDEEEAAPFGSVDPVTGTPEFDGGDFLAFMAGVMAFGLVYYLATQLATAACYRIVSAAYLGDDVDWRSSLRFALSRLGSLVWLSIVMGVALLIGFLLCVIPAVYLYGAFTVAVPVLLTEDRMRGTRALKRSRSLVKGRWWKVVAVVWLGLFLASIVSNLLSGVIGVAVGATGNDVVAMLGNTVANTLGTTLVTPFTAAVTAVVYFDLRIRKEGFDLELLAERIGVTPGEHTPFIAPPPPPPTSGAQPPYWPPPPGWRPPDA